MKTVCFASIKGGTGKTSIAILMANYLARAGYRVLVLDLDIQNSLSWYYLEDPEQAAERNLARALLSKDLAANILPSRYSGGLQVIPSALELVDLRALSEHTLARLKGQIEGAFDVLVIDTAPTYDNLVLNGLIAADLVVSPCRLSGFDYKGLLFLRRKLEEDAGGLQGWRVLINCYRRPRSDKADNMTRQYLSLFQSAFPQLLPFQIPESSLIRRAIDAREPVSLAQAKRHVFDAVARLAAMIVEQRTPIPAGRF